MNKAFLILLILLTASLGCSAQNNAETFKKIEWLIGNWQGEADGMPFYESWAKTSDTQFTNLNYSICGGEVVENDHGKIEARNGQIVYGDSHKLTSVSGTEVVFENQGRGERFTFQHTSDGKWLAKLQYPRTTVEYVLTRVLPVSELTKVKPKPLDGRYSGYLEFQGKQLKTAIDFERQNGRQGAFVTTPDNLQLRMPVRNLCHNPPFVSLAISEGNQTLTLNAKIEGDTIKGKIASREFPARLVLTKDPGYQRAKLNYRVEKVFVVHGKVNLNANLFLPNSKKPVAAVIMVAGTGQRTKEEYNGWADLLASRGFAVLTYDKRNVTNFPNLNIRNAPTDIGNINDLVEDAAQAFRLLETRKEVDPQKIGFLGFSQGAVVVAIAAGNNPKAAFVVGISGNTTTDREFIINQALNRLRARRADAAALKKAEDLMNKLFAYAKTRSGGAELQKELDAAHNEGWGRFTVPRQLPNDDELKYLMTYNGFEIDPAQSWAKIRVPTLFIFGGRDDLIPVERSVEIINRVFADKSTLLTVKVYPHANHFIKTSSNPQSFEWSKFADGYVEDLTAWLEKQKRA